MIRYLIIYYKLYLIFIPYFIFWVIFTTFFIEVLSVKFLNKKKTYYFPENTEYPFINFLVIYPKRIAFTSIYYWKATNFFSLNNLYILIKSLLIFLIIGIPFIYLKIIYLLITHKKIYIVWYKTSTYKNIKLIIQNKKIIRNMLKHLHEQYVKAIKIANTRTVSKLIMLEDKPAHLVTYDEETEIGGLHTSKVLTQKDEEFKIKNVPNSYTYAQIINKNNLFIEESKINNEILKNLAKEKMYGPLGNYALFIAKNNSYIRENINNKQIFKQVNNAMKEKPQKLINIYGGETKMQIILHAHNQTVKDRQILEQALNILPNLNQNEKKIKALIIKNSMERYAEYCKHAKLEEGLELVEKINELL